MHGRFSLPSRDLDFRWTPSVLAITYCEYWMNDGRASSIHQFSRLQQLRASNKKRCSVVQVIVWNLLKRPVSFPFGSSLYWYLSIPDSRSYFTLPENKYAMKLRAFNSYYMNGMYRCHLLLRLCLPSQILKWSFVADRGPSTSLSRQQLERIESNFSGTILFLDRINMETIRYSHIRTM
jgi:hypothetical protein